MKHSHPDGNPGVQPISGWGGPPVLARQRLASDLESATSGAVLTRGLGRSYGDCSLPPPSRREVVASPLADRILAFDEASGLLRAEAGLSLRQIVEVFLPRSWFVPVVPGTWNVTLGGMVAADVHGKNHHVAGCFGEHVTRLVLRVADGRVIECSREREPELFHATLGGMGLTGHILEVELRMERIPSPWILAEEFRVPSIDELVVALERSAGAWPFTVGWVDCLARGDELGRGILIRGRWAEAHEARRSPPRAHRRPSVPVYLPEGLMSGPVVRWFNAQLYFSRRRSPRPRVESPQSFFFPLDAIGHWNRLYGRRGVAQYQCVLPRSSGPGAVRRVLGVLAERGGASFLCVVKDCGAESSGLLSFPMPGTSLAFDLPIRDDTRDLVARLNLRVIEEGGRIYLAKDAFTTPEHFRAMETRFERWQSVRLAWDPNRTIRSAQSERLFGDPA